MQVVEVFIEEDQEVVEMVLGSLLRPSARILDVEIRCRRKEVLSSGRLAWTPRARFHEELSTRACRHRRSPFESCAMLDSVEAVPVEQMFRYVGCETQCLAAVAKRSRVPGERHRIVNSSYREDGFGSLSVRFIHETQQLLASDRRSRVQAKQTRPKKYFRENQPCIEKTDFGRYLTAAGAPHCSRELGGADADDWCTLECVHIYRIVARTRRCSSHDISSASYIHII